MIGWFLQSIDLNKNLSERIKCNFEKICNGEVDLLIKSELENKKISLNIIQKIVDARIDETLDYIYKNITSSWWKQYNLVAFIRLLNGIIALWSPLRLA